MNYTKRFLTAITAAILFCGCLPASPATPIPAAAWDERLNATARVVVNATFFAPTMTFTPSPTATITLTPSPTRPKPVPSATAMLPSCIHPEHETQSGRVTAVIDGETILVEIGGKEYKVRYIGIDAPTDAQIKQPYGEKATAINRELVEGQTVKLMKDATEADKSGRLPRYVFTGNIFVNLELVRLGLATAISQPPDTACFDLFHQAEHEANQKRVGLWSKPSPTKTPLGYGLENVVEVPCDCYGPELDCPDFINQGQAQACFNYCNRVGLGDLFDLDANRNQRACDGLP